MRVARGSQNNPSLPERFTGRTRKGVKTQFGKCRTVKRSNWALLVTFRLAFTVSIAAYDSHQS